MIYALASLFDFADDPKMVLAWERIEHVFNIAGIALTHLPHFSWHVAQSYEFNGLDQRLNTFVKDLEPFHLHIAGAGIFSGENPVIYLPVTKTPVISGIHNSLSKWIGDFTTTTNPNYDPEFWIPHITLSGENFNSDGICQVLSELAYIRMDIDLVIDHIAVIYRNENSSGVQKIFRFGVSNL
jgi:2'-5' RNA ligase